MTIPINDNLKVSGLVNCRFDCCDDSDLFNPVPLDKVRTLCDDDELDIGMDFVKFMEEDHIIECNNIDGISIESENTNTNSTGSCSSTDAGVPTSTTIPIDTTITTTTTRNYMAYLAAQRRNKKKENRTPKQIPLDPKVGDHPLEYDVICGRDKLSYAHAGNKRFRIMIEMNRERYQRASNREEKSHITVEIVSITRSCSPGGRFLRLDVESNKWFEVGDEYAHEKVSHALRSARNPSRSASSFRKESIQRSKKNTTKATRKKCKSSIKRKVEDPMKNVEENLVYQRLVAAQKRIFEYLVRTDNELLDHKDQFSNQNSCPSSCY